MVLLRVHVEGLLLLDGAGGAVGRGTRSALRGSVRGSVSVRLVAGGRRSRDAREVDGRQAERASRLGQQKVRLVREGDSLARVHRGVGVRHGRNAQLAVGKAVRGVEPQVPRVPAVPSPPAAVQGGGRIAGGVPLCWDVIDYLGCAHLAEDRRWLHLLAHRRHLFRSDSLVGGRRRAQRSIADVPEL